MNPRICVVIPTHNSAAYVADAIASVQRQTLPVEEIIVVDDGSSDNSAALASTHGARVIIQKNAGPAAARNAGVRAAHADWIAFLDADDTWMEHKLERQFQAISQAQEVNLIFSDFLFLDERGIHRQTGFDAVESVRRITRFRLGDRIWLCDRKSAGEALVRAMFILTSSLVIRRETLLQSGLFDTTLRCAEDYDLFLRLLVHNQAAYVDEALVRYRRHPNSITVDLDLDILSRDQLIERCQTNPERYPSGAAAYLAAQRTHWIARAALFALRSGNFQAARQRALLSLRTHPNVAALNIFIIACLCDNRIGHTLHSLLRSLWAQRPGKYHPV